MTDQIVNCRIAPSKTEIGRTLARHKTRSVIHVVQEGVFLGCQVTEAEARALHQVAKHQCVDLRRLSGGLVEVDAYVDLPTALRMLAILQPAVEVQQRLH